MGHFEPDTNHRIWQVVAEIPAGQVCTYGLIARRAGLAGAARRVGAALRQLPADSAIPWHRVINAQGRIAFPEGSEAYRRQRTRLESEGISFKQSGKIDLDRYGW
jgi:methylated-DNA-protein-cysteine methyltransferase-like protein